MVLVELKSVEAVAPVHKKTLLTYLRIADKRVGLLINFGEEVLKKGIHRIVNNYTEENSSQRHQQWLRQKYERILRGLCASA